MTRSSPEPIENFVVDTHALYWYLEAPSRRSLRVQAVFRAAEDGAAHQFVPAVVAAELYWLLAKQGQTERFRPIMELLLKSPFVTFVPFRAEDALGFETDAAVPEMHDRMIVGVARRLRVPLVTRDGQIQASSAVPVVW